MAARCASCSYPLSVSDSVSCYECSSYFHIDCAQLVGFPYYELSSDPNKNTFHCTTCKILPLPKQCDSDSDSDFDIMPSRQLDYHMEGQSDFIKDVNEVKGSVQDLSDLCKDMFREINELKSINLTLRCCVENLRHENEQRDNAIADLKKRIEIIEGIQKNRIFQPVEDTILDVERLNEEKEDETERYLTPDPEYARERETEESLLDEPYELQCNSNQNYIYDRSMSLTDNINEPSEHISEWKSRNDVGTDDIDYKNNYSYDFGQNRDNSISNYTQINFAELVINKSSDELNEEIGTEKHITVKDWNWKGNKAVELDKCDESKNTTDDPEDPAIDDTETQDWEILGEDESSKFNVEKLSQYARLVNEESEMDDDAQDENVEDEEEEETEEQVESHDQCVYEEKSEQKRVTWAEELGSDKDDDSWIQEDESVEYNYQNSQELSSFETNPAYETLNEGEEIEEKRSFTDEITDKISLGESDPIAKPEAETVEGGTFVEGVDEGSRLDGEQDGEMGVRGETLPEGELTGGQSPVVGEVQPEPSEGTEAPPPPPPEPQHSPDDLWDYLKETVSGEHPATVEEFVQKLIGTLEHVPEEYLKPVIDANIKRATTPSVTDGEHLNLSEDEIHKNEQTDKEREASLQEGEVVQEGEKIQEGDIIAENIGTPLPDAEGELQATSEEYNPQEESRAPEEVSESAIPEEPVLNDDQYGSTEDYKALQATD